MTSTRQPRRPAILALLREHGPMTSQQIAEELEWDVGVVVATITTARRYLPQQMFRITGYVPRVGKWGTDMAVFSAAGGKDVARVNANRAARQKQARKRHRDKHLEVYRAKDRARRRAKKGEQGKPVEPMNPWLQLADKSLRARMGQITNDARFQPGPAQRAA